VIKECTGTIGIHPENIPDELKRRPQWVCWRYEERDEKWTKVPYTPETGLRASTTDLMTWRPFEDAVQALGADDEMRERMRLPQYDGIGLVLSSADPFVGIDLDNCRDAEMGELTAWARKILDRVDGGYVEISPSGTGIHVIVEGKVRGGKTQRKISDGKIEMYGAERFFTITGVLL
jgi:putative DNA primase/helicase